MLAPSSRFSDRNVYMIIQKQKPNQNKQTNRQILQHKYLIGSSCCSHQMQRGYRAVQVAFYGFDWSDQRCFFLFIWRKLFWVKVVFALKFLQTLLSWNTSKQQVEKKMDYTSLLDDIWSACCLLYTPALSHQVPFPLLQISSMLQFTFRQLWSQGTYKQVFIDGTHI